MKMCSSIVRVVVAKNKLPTFQRIGFDSIAPYCESNFGMEKKKPKKNNGTW